VIAGGASPADTPDMLAARAQEKVTLKRWLREVQASRRASPDPKYHPRVISMAIEILTWLRFPYTFLRAGMPYYDVEQVELSIANDS
jgi:hypothetical protein